MGRKRCEAGEVAELLFLPGLLLVASGGAALPCDGCNSKVQATSGVYLNAKNDSCNAKLIL